jgi:hypothetical protein
MSSFTPTSDLLPAVLASPIRWPAIQHENADDENDCCNALLHELHRYGLLNDPRAPNSRADSLDDYIRSEVLRSINRIRLLRRLARPLDGPMPTADELRRLGRVLAEVAFTRVQVAAARELEELDRERPELAYAIKYHCAEEASFLIGCFSSKPRDHLTNWRHGGFRVMAERLYRTITNEVDADVSRACDRLLKNWRRFAAKE